MKRFFARYGSLENHTQGRFISIIQHTGVDEGEWVAREKIHGSNYGMWSAGEDVWRSKRSAVTGTDFFSGEKLDKYEVHVLETYRNLLEAELLTEGEPMVIYGEIFGGHFFGETEAGSKIVQRGMNYHPSTEFMAYDIMVGNPQRILSDAQMVQYISKGIKLCPEVGRGTFEKLINMPNDFASLVPAAFGLTPPEGKTSQCEGFVMRPAHGDRFVRNDQRVIIKSKNAKFNEKGAKPAKVQDPLSETELALNDSFTPYLSVPRLEAVISKEGEVTWKDFGKLQGLYLQDAIKDYEHDNDCILKDNPDWARIKKLAGGVSAGNVRAYLKTTG